MLYESKVSFTKIVKGNDKVMKEKYMVAEAESFGDAETQTYEEGEEVELIYKLALFANDFDQAYKRVNEYLKQGYNMQAVGMKKTKFVDVIS